MNDKTLLANIVVKKALTPMELKLTLKQAVENGALPQDITEYPVHVVIDDKGKYHYSVYERFDNIINITVL